MSFAVLSQRKVDDLDLNLAVTRSGVICFILRLVDMGCIHGNWGNSSITFNGYVSTPGHTYLSDDKVLISVNTYN